MTLLTIAAATLISEDITCIAVGLLIQQGLVDPVAGITACAAGIYVGDLGLFVGGRLFGARALSYEPVRRHLTPERQSRFAQWFTERAGSIVVGSRFVPGTRLPLYVAAGATGVATRPFATWTLAAVLMWTPALVLLAARSADAADGLTGAAGASWWSRVALVVIGFVGWRLGGRLATRRGRQSMMAAASRLWRWEFWPMSVFYAPVAIWIAWLLIRYRGVAAITAANPGIADGGLVGESKFQILAQLPQRWTVPSFLLHPGDHDARMSRVVAALSHNGWSFPVIFKPDVGQRGTGVKLVRSQDDAREYFARETGAIVVQPYHPGPFEAGVFYYRFPDSPRGRILSITDKHFPQVIGDGGSTLEELIWNDARLRMQADRFLDRHAAARDRVLADGERMALALAGNHCQGTLFKDGRHLITPALERRIDDIARQFPGFFIGRFDIRYGDVDRFKAGEDLAIVELNGATAESTNIYDPSGALLSAYRQLFRQWSLVFAIGSANLSRGAPGSSWRRVIDLLVAHRRRVEAFGTSD